MVTMVLGALSFLVSTCLECGQPGSHREGAPGEGRSEVAQKPGGGIAGTSWQLGTLRVLLFKAFSVLSWQATQGSHQFAAVVEALTAWNFAEWAAALQHRAAAAGD